MKNEKLKTPFPRSYWVIPGMLLAGQFPGAKSDSEAKNKLEALIDCGIRKIINLMQASETDHYGNLFNRYEEVVSRIAGEKRIAISCLRLPVADLNVPTVSQMHEILDVITTSIEYLEPVYVPCWGGVGRTGMAVGCFLIKNGLAQPSDVLKTIADLRTDDPVRHRTSPETEAQRQFVVNWLMNEKGPPTRLSRTIGCMLGGAVGDALGAPVEFKTIDEIRSRCGQSGITHYAEAYGRTGAITDDTQMAMFTAEGLLRAWVRGNTRGICNPASVVHHAYVQWLNTQGQQSKSCFNNSNAGLLIHHQELWSRRAPGNSCLSALQKAEMGTVENPTNDSKGCGGVMRAAPVGLIAGNEREAFSLGCEIAAITHGHPTGYLAAGALAAIIFHVKNCGSLHSAINSALKLLENRPDHQECTNVILRALKLGDKQVVTDSDVRVLGQGWIAEEALAISLLCAMTCENDFDKALVLAVNHSGDSDSTGAITGNILGCLLGRQGIDHSWTDGLELKEMIQALAVDLWIGFQNSEHWQDKYPGW